MKVLNGFLGSKKFWAVAAGIVLLSVKSALPEMADLSNGELVALIASYVLGQGLSDFGKERAKITMAANDG